MSDSIRIFRFRFQENSPLFLETWGAYRADDPMIEEAYRIRVTLPEDCTIERLIRSAETARKLIDGELGGKLDWGPHYQVVTEDYATSRPLRGVEVFQQKLKNLYDVALSKYCWDGVECSFKSRDEVIKWLDRFIEWAESKVPPVTPVLEKKKRTGGRRKNADTDNGVRITAALCKHHQYENCTVGNREPGSLPEIAKLAGIPKTNKKAVSDFMIKNFGSHAEYKDQCRKKTIDLKLAQWQGELIPHVQRLFDTDGAIPDPPADD